jgi:glutamine amidotransferase
MCLIAYVPDGKALADDVYTAAYTDNNDGIGIMSRLGVVRFIGKKQLKKARKYTRQQLEPSGVPYAIHFRFATHGDVNLSNTHPFVLPDGKSYLMHNGVISWCGYDAVKSDTGVFADLLDDYPGLENVEYLKQLGSIIGYGNKLCIMNADGSFSLVNADAGLWDNGVWYSNTYSLPDRLDPWRKRTDSSYTTGRGNLLSFKRTSNWLADYDNSRAAKELDWEKDLRLTTQRDDDKPTDLHGGCGLPVPHGYRIKSQYDYYESLEA